MFEDIALKQSEGVCAADLVLPHPDRIDKKQTADALRLSDCHLGGKCGTQPVPANENALRDVQLIKRMPVSDGKLAQRSKTSNFFGNTPTRMMRQ